MGSGGSEGRFSEVGPIILVQTVALKRQIESRPWVVHTSLGMFSDGKYFIWVDADPELRITPQSLLMGTWKQGEPLHITLGWPANTLSQDQLMELAGLTTGSCIVHLHKWSRRWESTTYLPSGQLLEMCRACEVLGFKPRHKWHISL